MRLAPKLKQLQASEDLLFSFDGIEFLSRSAAHELLVYFDTLTDEGYRISKEALTGDVKEMMALVEKTRYASERPKREIEVQVIESLDAIPNID